MTSEQAQPVPIWSNTLGTRLDALHSHKIIQYNGICYAAQPLNYKDEIKPKQAEFVFGAVDDRIRRDEIYIRQTINAIRPAMHCRELNAIPSEKENDYAPFWNNGYFGGSDARASYAIISQLKPTKIIEVGSGNSTRFFRKAIHDSRLSTAIISVDPHPRVDIANIVDEVIAESVVDIDPILFDRLCPGDILFWDGSHVSVNGSDVCTLFLEAIPRLAPGVLVHVHDVSLPYAGFNHFQDVPADLRTLSTSEQLMLATLLLSARSVKVVLPVYQLWKQGIFADFGSSFWFLTG